MEKVRIKKKKKGSNLHFKKPEFGSWISEVNNKKKSFIDIFNNALIPFNISELQCIYKKITSCMTVIKILQANSSDIWCHKLMPL